MQLNVARCPITDGQEELGTEEEARNETGRARNEEELRMEEETRL